MSNSDGRYALAQGRIVWIPKGAKNLFDGAPQTVYGTNTPKIGKDGEQSTQYGFGLAIPKLTFADPNVGGALWQAMHEEAYTLFPNGQIPPSFAMKYKDGDTAVDQEGKPYSLREGYAEHYVFSLTTNLLPRFFKWEGGQNIQIVKGIKCGDYVRVRIKVKAHPAQGAGKAGLYLNPMDVQLVAEGKEIVYAPSGDDVFGSVAPVAPAGIVVPQVPQMPAAAPSMPMAPAGFPAPGAVATHTATPPAAPSIATPAAPHYPVIPPALQPQHNGMPAIPPMPGAPR